MTFVQTILADSPANYTPLQALQYVRNGFLVDERCSVYDSDYTAASPWFVLDFDAQNNKLFAHTYLHLDIVSATFQMRHRYNSSWNALANSGDDPNSAINHTLNGNLIPLKGRVFSSSEMVLVCVEQQNTNNFYTWYLARNSIRRSYHSEDIRPLSLFGHATTFNSLEACQVNPYSIGGQVAISTNLGDARYASIDSQGDREVRDGIVLFSSDNSGTHGGFSDDFLMGCFVGLPRWYQFVINAKTYIVINPIAGGLALRIG